MIEYPLNLPCPVISGNNSSPSSTFVRTTLQYEFQQRRVPRGKHVVNYSVVLTNQQMNEFRLWYTNTLGSGMISFTADWEIEGDNLPKTYRFDTPFTVTNITGELVELSAVLELRTNITTMKRVFDVVAVDNFTASNNEAREIVFTWTNDYNTTQYDLYEDGILLESNISVGYNIQARDEVERTFFLRQTNSQSTVDSNSAVGKGIIPPMKDDVQLTITGYNDEFISFYVFGGGCKVASYQGIYTSYPEGWVTVKVRYTAVIQFEPTVTRITFSTNDNYTHSITEIVMDCIQLDTLSYFVGITWELTKLELHNTDYITDFSYAIGDCDILETFTIGDTSRGTDFSKMMYGCIALTTVPYMNTENGTLFSEMFYNCNSLTRITALNTLNQTNTTNMFYNTPLLTEPNGTEQSFLLQGYDYIAPTP